jgi:hypothetical protein
MDMFDELRQLFGGDRLPPVMGQAFQRPAVGRRIVQFQVLFVDNKAGSRLAQMLRARGGRDLQRVVAGR